MSDAEKKPQRVLFAEPNQDGRYPYGELRYTVRELGASGEWSVIARGLTREEAQRLPCKTVAERPAENREAGYAFKMSDKYLVTTQLIPQRAAEKVLPALREALDFGVQFVLLSPGESNPPPGIVSEPWGVAVGVIKIMGHPDDQIEEALAPLKALDMHLSFEWVMIR